MTTDDLNPKDLALMLYKMNLETNSIVRAMAEKICLLEADLTMIKVAMENVANGVNPEFDSEDQEKFREELKGFAEKKIELRSPVIESITELRLKRFIEGITDEIKSNELDYILDPHKQFSSLEK